MRGRHPRAAGDAGVSAASSASADRVSLLRRALRLEYLTVGWNVVEGVVAVAAAVNSGSVALLGFGIDTFVESASGSVLVWRLRADPVAAYGIAFFLLREGQEAWLGEGHDAGPSEGLHVVDDSSGGRP